jgi:predicted nucleotidyltransferase
MAIAAGPRKAILAGLRSIAQDNGIHVIGAIEAGSRSWGFSSSDSDYDVRFLYCRPIDYYLGLDSIGAPDTITKFDAPYDFHGWDVRKAAKLGVCSNPSLYEWAASDINYCGTLRFSQLCDIVKTHYGLDTIARSYHHIAKGHYEKYVRPLEPTNIKRLLYITRSLLAQQYILEHNTLPPIKLGKLTPLLADPVYDDLEGLLHKKYSGTEQTTSIIPPHLHNYIHSCFAYNDPNSLTLSNSNHEKSFAAFSNWLLAAVKTQ